MKKTQLARLLAYVSGMVNQQLLLQNEYLIAENRILRSHLPARVRLSDLQRATLAQIAKRMGRRALEEALIDIPRLKNIPFLEPGTAIYPEDLDAWEKK